MTFSEIFSAIYGANRRSNALYRRAMGELRGLPPGMRACWTEYRDRRVARDRGIGGLGIVAAAVLMSSLAGCVTFSSPANYELPRDCVHVAFPQCSQ